MFNHVANDYTVTATSRLICELKVERQTIQLMFGVGAIIGVIVVNFSSDLYSRKFSVMLGIVAQVVSTFLLLLGSAVNSTILFYLAEILAGFGSLSLLPACYVYVDKIMSKRWAERVILMINGFG